MLTGTINVVTVSVEGHKTTNNTTDGEKTPCDPLIHRLFHAVLLQIDIFILKPYHFTVCGSMFDIAIEPVECVRSIYQV